MRLETIELPAPIRITPFTDHGYEVAHSIQYDHKRAEAALCYGAALHPEKGIHGPMSSYVGVRWPMAADEWEKERTYWLNKGGTLEA